MDAFERSSNGRSEGMFLRTVAFEAYSAWTLGTTWYCLHCCIAFFKRKQASSVQACSKRQISGTQQGHAHIARHLAASSITQREAGEIGTSIMLAICMYRRWHGAETNICTATRSKGSCVSLASVLDRRYEWVGFDLGCWLSDAPGSLPIDSSTQTISACCTAHSVADEKVHQIVSKDPTVPLTARQHRMPDHKPTFCSREVA